MKVHAYLREKVLYGLRVPSAPPSSPRRGTQRGKGAVSADDAASSPVPSDGTAEPRQGERVYKKYADFVPAFAAQSGVTVADLNQPDIDIQDSQVELGRFIYFCFAPTLIYRDSYPRSGNEVGMFLGGTCAMPLCLLWLVP